MSRLRQCITMNFHYSKRMQSVLYMVLVMLLQHLHMIGGTGIYHVGTSAGRSDFRGLERINNTTTAITNTIAADDGMIVER